MIKKCVHFNITASFHSSAQPKKADTLSRIYGEEADASGFDEERKMVSKFAYVLAHCILLAEVKKDDNDCQRI